jgi:hypothetical protein
VPPQMEDEEAITSSFRSSKSDNDNQCAICKFVITVNTKGTRNLCSTIWLQPLQLLVASLVPLLLRQS